MTEYQHTIQKRVSFSGKGLHTGEMTQVILHPAEVHTGIVFRRTKHGKTVDIKADCDLVSDTSRSTNLEFQGVKVSTVEHLMSALIAFGIDNLIVEMDNQEIPILDGSAAIFLELLREAGIKKQEAERKIVYLDKIVTYKDEKGNIEITAIPSDKLELIVMVDYNSEVIGRQYAELKNLSEFEKNFSKARTFCFLDEIATLFHQGLIKGGELSNALVIVDKNRKFKDVNRLAAEFHQEIKVIPENGYLNNVELRYSNEIAKHKLIDLLGDIGLVGVNLKCKIIAQRAGHASHVAFAKLLKQSIEQQEIENKTTVQDYLMDTEEIKSILPHRAPMLMIDAILEMNETSITGLKYVKANESYFKGHFPQQPIMPGVLQVEALAQTGAVLVLSKQKEMKKLPFLVKINECLFKSPVFPGDSLIIKVNLIGNMVRNFQRMEGCIFVNDKIVTEIKLTAKIVES